ncbi:hypothetical protein L1994_10770 [Methanomicrobium antiquum]|uniref:Uncharacterized protein n=1 Tax=Methanomicrobium antiquum TaxID=487686 RepID=A0AAF0FU84_9EURY|nr:hypothetical protein [Methanomicrobium antiquum]WFN36608.1 hypothetical protein L1994_10770 [Methanomicrobium antiquum]
MNENKCKIGENKSFLRFLTALLIFLIVIITEIPVQAISAEATEEQLKVMNELEGSDITIGEYLKKTWPQFYDELTEEQKERVNRWNRSWPKDPVSIEEKDVNWHSQNISSNITALNINLKWKNPASNLSLKIYSPDGKSFGPFYDGFDNITNGQIYFFIRKDSGLSTGEWWYAVKGETVNGTEKYTL